MKRRNYPKSRVSLLPRNIEGVSLEGLQEDPEIVVTLSPDPSPKTWPWTRNHLIAVVTLSAGGIAFFTGSVLEYLTAVEKLAFEREKDAISLVSAPPAYDKDGNSLPPNERIRQMRQRAIKLLNKGSDHQIPAKAADEHILGTEEIRLV